MRFRPRSWSKFVPSLLLLCSLAVLFAAGPKPKPAPKPAASKVPKVTVTKFDGKTVVGELVEATPAALTLKPVTADAAPVTVAWAEVKAVSNGLTRRKVVDDYQTLHADLLCVDCHGLGTTKCEVCHGSGVDAAQGKPCDKCKGTGDQGKCPKCADGKVPCPATCLKPSMFAGLPVNPDGKKHKTFHNRDGSGQWWSEAHVGELVVQENGTWTNKGKCPTCGGTSVVVCPTCHGTAKRECPTCHGGGVIGPACTAGCKAGQVTCKTCAGTGLKPTGTPDAAGAAAAGKS